VLCCRAVIYIAFLGVTRGYKDDVQREQLAHSVLVARCFLHGFHMYAMQGKPPSRGTPCPPKASVPER